MLESYAGQKLCIFISKNDKYEGIVLYELLLEIAFNSRLSGGTVTIGDKGFFGAQDESTQLKILRSSENLPVVLEFQGRTNRINRYIERIEPMIKEGLFTLADVKITKFNPPDEETEDFEDQKNQDQSKIFDEENNGSNIPQPELESIDETFEEDQDSIVSDSEGQGDATDQPEDDEPVSSEFLEAEEDQNIEAEIVDTPEPDVEISSFGDDDAQAFETIEEDPGDLPEDEVKEAPEPHGEEEPYVESEEDESETPEFQSLDDDPINDEAEDDILEDETEPIIEEEVEEDDAVLQLADLSETLAEEGDGDNLEMEIPDESEPDTSNTAEFTEPKTEDEIDALFEESSEKFESSFDEMLKQAGGASVADAGLDSEDEKPLKKEPEDLSGHEPDEKDESDSETYDKNHTDEDMKNYFSSLFKK